MKSLFIFITLISPFSYAGLSDTKVRIDAKQEISSFDSNDPTNAKKSTRRTNVFETDAFRVDVRGGVGEDIKYRFRYAFYSPGQVTNLLEYGYLEFNPGPNLSIRGGRQFGLAGGIETNYFLTGDYYMYSLANLNLLSKFAGAYVDALSATFKPDSSNTLKLIAGNGKAGSAPSTQQTPYGGLTWESNFHDSLLMSFVSYFRVPTAETYDSTSGAVTANASEYVLGTVGLRLKLNAVEAHIDYQNYDFGQASILKSKHDINIAQVWFVGYTSGAYLHRLVLAQTDVQLEQVKSQTRQAVSYAVDYSLNPMVKIFGLINNSKDVYEDSRGTVSENKLQLGYKAIVDL